jgi:hypothetical protein
MLCLTSALSRSVSVLPEKDQPTRPRVCAPRFRGDRLFSTALNAVGKVAHGVASSAFGVLAGVGGQQHKARGEAKRKPANGQDEKILEPVKRATGANHTMKRYL